MTDQDTPAWSRPSARPCGQRKTACLLICFLIEFLPPFLRLVNPCTGLWADDWRVITGCWHVCFLRASPLALLTAKAAKPFCWSISPFLLCTSSSSSPPVCFSFLLLSPLHYLVLVPCTLISALPSHSLHISEELSHPGGNLKSGSSAEWKRSSAQFFFFFPRMKRKGTGPLFHFVIIFCAGLSSVASVRAEAELSFSILWGHMLIKQPADNSNYLSVASAPHWGRPVREVCLLSSPSVQRLILFLISAHPEWYTKRSLPATVLLCLPASLSSPY